MAFNKFKKFNSFGSTSKNINNSNESEEEIKPLEKKINKPLTNPLNTVPKGIEIIEESDEDLDKNKSSSIPKQTKPEKMERIMKIVESDNISEGGNAIKNKPLSSFQKLCNINKYSNIEFLDEAKKDESTSDSDSESEDLDAEKKSDSEIEVDEITFELQDENPKNLINFDIPILWVPCEELCKSILGKKISKIYLQNHYSQCDKCETTDNNNKNNIKIENLQVTHRNNSDLKEMNSIIKHYKYLKPYSMTKKFYKDTYSKETNILLFYSNSDEKFYNNCMFILNINKMQ